MNSTEIARLLPDVFQYAIMPPAAGVIEPDRRMAAALGAMEVLHEPCEQVLQDLHRYLDPRQTPGRFVSYLAGWVDLDWLLLPGPDQPSASPIPLASGLGRLRELVAAASELARWRGTARGLLRFLDTATGIPGFTIEENVSSANRVPRAFHLWVRAPQAASPFQPLIERVIRAEKPAYVTYELTFGDAEPEG